MCIWLGQIMVSACVRACMHTCVCACVQWSVSGCPDGSDQCQAVQVTVISVWLSRSQWLVSGCPDDSDQCQAVQMTVISVRLSKWQWSVSGCPSDSDQCLAVQMAVIVAKNSKASQHNLKGKKQKQATKHKTSSDMFPSCWFYFLAFRCQIQFVW